MIKISITLIFLLAQLDLLLANLNAKIVIIGGGISGLAAANELNNYGFKDIKILEADYKLGGRANSVPYNNGYLELGAQWIHGQRGNPVFNLLNSVNEIDYGTIFFRDTTVHQTTQDGKKIDANFADYVSESTEDFFDRIYDKIKDIDENSQVSVGSYLDQIYQNFLVQLKSRYPNYDKTLVSSIVQSVVQDQKTDYAVDSFYELTAAGINEGVDFGGNQFTNLKNGYFKLIDLLSSNLTSKFIHLNKLVTNIDYSNKSEIVLSAYDFYTRSKVKYIADYVLVTIPLGVLKQNHKSLFRPSLPRAKVNAIEKLGFGTVNKIFAIYDKPVFTGDDQGLQLFWRADLQNVSNLPYSDQKCNLMLNRFYKSFSTFNVLPKFKNILFAFLVGEDSIKSENVSDECLKDVIYELLLKFYPKLNLPRPINIIRSKWNSNQNSRGSYSYMKVGSYPSDVKQLASPIENRIFFSGEATDARYIGATQGALISGISRAKNIAKALNVIRQ